MRTKDRWKKRWKVFVGEKIYFHKSVSPESRVLEARAVALNDSRREDVDDVGGEFADVVGNADQHARALGVVVALDVELCARTGVRRN